MHRRARALFVAVVSVCSLSATTLASAAPPPASTQSGAGRGTSMDELDRGTPVAPLDVTLVQPDGAAFSATGWGDGRMNGYETRDGHSVVKDQNRVWVYADGRLPNGKLKPTSARPDAGPAPKGVAAHQRPDPKAYPAPSSGSSTSGGTTGSLGGSGAPLQAPATPNTGTQHSLVILAQFADQASVGTTAAQWHDRFFGATNSVHDFYATASFNALDIEPAAETDGTANDGVVGWLTLPYNHPNFGSDFTNSGGVGSQQLATDAMTAADPYVNYGSYDTDGNGIIDPNELHITVVVAGYDTSYGGASAACSPNIWPHKWGAPAVSLDGKWVGSNYTEFGEEDCVTTNTADAHMAALGTVVHEFGHDLGWTDLYDKDGSTEGIGDWSIMAGGEWNATSGQHLGDTPALPDAYSKALQGWITPTATPLGSPATAVTDAETTGSALEVLDNPGGYDWTVSTPGTGEFFLVENREQTGYDAGLPGCGVLVWRVDETRTDNADESDRLITLLQADGAGDLDMASTGNRGDTGDPYPGSSGNHVLTGYTTPSNHLHDGSLTGMNLDVTDPGGSHCAPSMDVTLSLSPSSADLDPTFAGAGLWGDDTSGGGNFDSLHAVALQADGKIVAAGDKITPDVPGHFLGQSDFQVVRLDADGTIDPTFGNGGVATVDLGSDEAGTSVLVQTDGKIVVGGNVRTPAGCSTACTVSAALGRLNADGSLDTTFGTSGHVLTSAGTDALWHALAFDGTSIVAAGSDGADVLVGRFTAAGAPDTSFSGDGVTTFDAGQAEDIATSVAVRSDHSVVVAGGNQTWGGPSDLVLARLDGTGALDTSFGTGGITTTDLNVADLAHALVVAADGSAVVAGTTGDTNTSDLVLAAYDSNGALDPTFGDGGTKVVDIDGGSDEAAGLARLADGSLLVTGNAEVAGAGTEMIVARFTTSGALDTTFSADGVAVATVAGAGMTMGSALAVDGSGRPVVAGSVLSSGPASSAVARFLADGDPTPGPTTPSITGFTPASGGPATAVSISGDDLAGATAVSFNGTAASFTASALGTVVAVVPDGATTGPIAVTTPDGVATSASDFVVGVLPVIDAFNPASAMEGDWINILGSGFTGATGVTFTGAAPTTAYVFDDNTIGAYVPTGASTGPVSVIGPDGTGRSTVDFTVVPTVAPVIIGFSPTSGPPGTSVTITGTGFGGTSDVSFGGVSAGFSTISDTEIDATVPIDAVTGTITVTNSAGTATSASEFTATASPAPTVTSFSPTSGAVGDVIDIYGTGLFTASTAQFGGVTASWVSPIDDTHIQAPVPTGATTGPITVTTGGGSASSSSEFTVSGGPTAPGNDMFANATTLTPDFGSTTGTNVGATAETGEPTHAGYSPGHSVWFSITPTTDGTVDLDTMTSDFDTVLGAYTGSTVDALTPVAENDDANGTTQSAISITATANTTYWIAIDGFSGVDTGNYVLHGTFAPAMVDNPPTVAITNPADGATVSGTVSITADATDDHGVTQVEFAVDDTVVGTDTDGSDGWSATWDATSATPGTHTITATATDTAAQTSSASVSVDGSGLTRFEESDPGAAYSGQWWHGTAA